jgi:hypothetical protein
VVGIEEQEILERPSASKSRNSLATPPVPRMWSRAVMNASLYNASS